MTISSLTPTARVMTLRRGQLRASLGLIMPRSSKFLDFGMVARNLRDRTVAHQIDAAVAGPQACKSAVHRQEGSDGGANGHATCRGDAADFGVGAAQPVFEAGAQVGCGTGNADGRQVLDDAGGGDLSGIVPAHPVSHQPKPAPRFDKIAVLV